MHLWQQHLRKHKYFWSVALLLAVLPIFGWLSKWDVAQNELTAYEDTFPVLIGSSSKVSVYGTSRNERRSQTFLLLPGSLDIPYTVTIQNENGTVTVDEDRYALLKFLVFTFIVVPLVRKLWKARQERLARPV